jgi:uncharacterized protein (DUF697 family)
MLSPTWLMKAAAGSLLRLSKRLPQWWLDAAGDESPASDQAAPEVKPQVRDGLPEADQARLMNTAAEALQRLRDRLDDVIRTRLPNWCRDAIGRDGEPGPSAADTSPAQKRQEAEQIIDRYAGLVAANAFNPIPVLDVGIDVRLLTAMSAALAAAYGLGQDQTRAPDYESQALHQAAERTIAGLLPRLGLELVARESSKWIPFIGSVVAARMGYRMACRFGEKVVQECEAEADTIAAGWHDSPVDSCTVI